MWVVLIPWPLIESTVLPKARSMVDYTHRDYDCISSPSIPCVMKSDIPRGCPLIIVDIAMEMKSEHPCNANFIMILWCFLQISHKPFNFRVLRCVSIWHHRCLLLTG